MIADPMNSTTSQRIVGAAKGVAGFFLFGACAKSLVAIDGRYELVT